MDNKNKHQCKSCGCKEFISSRTYSYEVFEADGDRISFVETIHEDISSGEYTPFELFCRDCSEKLEFSFDDMEYRTKF